MFSRPKARTQKHRGKCSYRCPACPATVNSKMFQPSRRAGVAGVWSSKYSVAESQTWRIFQVEIDGNSMLIDFQWFGKKYVKWIGFYIIPKKNIQFWKTNVRLIRTPSGWERQSRGTFESCTWAKRWGLGSCVESGTAQGQLKRSWGVSSMNRCNVWMRGTSTITSSLQLGEKKKKMDWCLKERAWQFPFLSVHVLVWTKNISKLHMMIIPGGFAFGHGPRGQDSFEVTIGVFQWFVGPAVTRGQERVRHISSLEQQLKKLTAEEEAIVWAEAHSVLVWCAQRLPGSRSFYYWRCAFIFWC